MPGFSKVALRARAFFHNLGFNKVMRLVSASVVLLLVCSTGYGQFSGRVTGRVVDATGAAVPGAEVQLFLNGGSKALLSAKTTTEGIYHFMGVRPSYYDLSV